MPDATDLSDRTRRTVIKGVAGALGISAMGTTSAHEWGVDDDEQAGGPAGENDPKHPDEGTRGDLENVDFVGYHGLGKLGGPADGSSSKFGSEARPYQKQYGKEAQEPHYGGVTEIRTHGDYAYVTFFSSDRPTPGRAMAIVDISQYNQAETDADLDDAELKVVGFLRNNNVPTAAMDVKISDDCQFAFLSTQPYAMLFGSIAGNTNDPTRAEGMDPMLNLEDRGYTSVPGGIVAIDVSDKANPQTVGSFQVQGSGSHNSFHHRIDSDDYVFAICDSGNLAGVGEGLYVLRFDRGSGEFELVNRWHFEDNNAQGEVSPSKYAYIHDLEIQDDPKTGTPVAYLAYWDRGLWALDVSDPANMEPLGNFDMDACHFATPAPTLINGKRVAIASQEVSESDDNTGRIYLVDADGLFAEDDRYYDVSRTQDGVALLGELDMWEWHAEYETPGEDTIDFGPYDFSLSPHNSDFARHIDDKGNESFWVHQSHYNGGIRFLKVTPGTDQGLVSYNERYRCRPGDDTGPCEGHDFTGRYGPHKTTDWELSEEGWARPNLETPSDSRMEGLNYLTPFCWGANQSNGVTFAADINQGVYALKQQDIPLGGALPDIEISRSDDGSVFTAGQTDRIQLTVSPNGEESDGNLLVRDEIPDGWDIVGGDGKTTQQGQFREFAAPSDETVAYFAEAPEETGAHQFGPVQVSIDDGATWQTVAGTTDTNLIVGADQNDVALGTVGVVGALSHQRDRIKEKAESMLRRD